MAVTKFGVGTVAAAASGNITPTLPGGFATNDVAILFCVQHDNVVSTITAGWTIVDATNNTTGLRTFWAWRRLTAGDGNPTITHAAGDSIIAQITVYHGVITSGNPYDVKSVSANVSSSTCTATAITPGTAGSRIVFLGGQLDDSTWSAYSGTNPTFVEDMDQLTTLGLDASFGTASGDKTDTTTTGSRTATASRAAINTGHMLALVPALMVTAQVCSLTLTPVAGTITTGGVTVVAQPCVLTLDSVQGTISAGGGGSPVTVTAQVCDLTLTPVANTPIVGSVTIVAQPCDLTLTPVPHAPIAGAVTITAQACTITLTPVAGTITAGPVTVAAQPCTFTLAGVQGSVSAGGGGAVTVTAQVCQLTLSPVAGSISVGPVAVVAQPCTFTLAPVAGARTTGSVSVVAQVCTLTLTPVAGIRTVGPVTVVAQPCTFTLVPVPHPPVVASNTTIVAQVCTFVLQCVSSTPTATAPVDLMEWPEVLALHSAIKAREMLWQPMPTFHERRPLPGRW